MLKNINSVIILNVFVNFNLSQPIGLTLVLVDERFVRVIVLTSGIKSQEKRLTETFLRIILTLRQNGTRGGFKKNFIKVGSTAHL